MDDVADKVIIYEKDLGVKLTSIKGDKAHVG